MSKVLEISRSRAELSHFRVAPRKVGLIADQVRGKSLPEALVYLKFSPRKRVAQALYKLLLSALANLGGFQMGDRIWVEKILVGQGPTLKRFRPRAKGSGFKINKKTSHVSVLLGRMELAASAQKSSATEAVTTEAAKE